MILSCSHLRILMKLKSHAIPYSSIPDERLDEYEYLSNNGCIEITSEIKTYDDPGISGFYSDPKSVQITQEGKAAFDTYIRDHLLVWLGILIDFVLAVIALIV